MAQRARIKLASTEIDKFTRSVVISVVLQKRLV